MQQTILPEPVSTAVNEIMQCMEGSLDNEVEVRSDLLKEELSKFFLKKFIDGSEFVMTEDEFIDMFHKAMIASTLEDLRKKGIVDSIDAEDGDPIFWLTSQGKEFVESMPL